MLDGFHKVYNAHAFNRLSKPVEFPDAQLGVGEGESLAPVNNAVKYPHKLKSVTQPELAHQSYELAQIDGFSDPLSVEDFPKEIFYGDSLSPVGGV